MKELWEWWDAHLDPDTSSYTEDRISKMIGYFADDAIMSILEAPRVNVEEGRVVLTHDGEYALVRVK